MTRPLALNERSITRAIILAAGTGSRLRVRADSTPKPMHPLAGKPLLVRVVESLRQAGIREVVVVLGFQGEVIRQGLLAHRERLPGLHFEFVWNHNYQARNGLSVLAAADYVDEPCLLSMADHFYAPTLAQRLLAARVPVDGCVLAVDRDIPRCFDLDDATKVLLEGNRIQRIGKELATYNALDTGVFRISRGLIDSLKRVADRDGDCSLSDGVQDASRQGRFWGCDIGDARWVDVDTPEAAAHAEMLVSVLGEDLASPVQPQALETREGAVLPSLMLALLQQQALRIEREGASLAAGA